MKSVLIVIFFIFNSVLNSQAEGYGTIRETDTQIIVEYQDDAVEEKPDTTQKLTTDIQPPQQAIEDKKEKKPNEIRRQKIESRLAQRAAQRKQEQERRLSGQY